MYNFFEYKLREIIMIDFYYWPTPNARKISILFEELNLKYNLIKIDINKGEQFGEKFLEIYSVKIII